MLVTVFTASCPCYAGFKQNTLLPFVIKVGVNDTLPKISDEEIFQNGAVVNFVVNKSEVNTQDKGFQTILYALSGLPKDYNYCRLLVMRGSASPEGPVALNTSLAHRRARAIADSLRRYVTVPDSNIEERYIPEDYKGLRRLIAASDMSYRPEILSIIDNGSNDATIKANLKKLDNGKAWRVLLDNFFPKLRATRVIILVSKQPITLKTGEKVVEQKIPDIVIPPPVFPKDTVDTVDTVPEKVFIPWIAVKTNAIYDAAATPNIEIERWFGSNNQWSVMGEWNFPWWQWHNKSRVYEVMEGGLELRRWLFPSHAEGGEKHRPLTGHFLGLYAAGAYYDLEWGYKGEQGDAYSAGLTYGYTCKLSKHWNMEFSISGGYLYSPYTHYDAERHDDTLFAKYKKHFTYIGPTKLKVSFVWLIGRTKNKTE